MGDINKVFLKGRLGKDPALTVTQQDNQEDKMMARFTLATGDKSKDGDKEFTEWHHVIVKGKNQVLACEKYLKKGSQVFVEGRLQTRSYMAAQKRQYITEILTWNVSFLDFKD